jgi:hypothetical protein
MTRPLVLVCLLTNELLGKKAMRDQLELAEG